MAVNREAAEVPPRQFRLRGARELGVRWPSAGEPMKSVHSGRVRRGSSTKTTRRNLNKS